MSTVSRKEARVRRHRRLRRQVTGTAERPRLAVCRTAQHMYAQLIDDTRHHTLASASTLSAAFRDTAAKTGNVAGAAVLGKLIAEKALAAQITEVVFDRGGFRYHGRVKALAEAARAGGLKF
ncbi:MAG: 50S ribosomal protein L18 [Lentisphaerae bacterium]|nr:50S ribosomal protein L18 [Lentisphaerota bacterium]